MLFKIDFRKSHGFFEEVEMQWGNFFRSKTHYPNLKAVLSDMRMRGSDEIGQDPFRTVSMNECSFIQQNSSGKQREAPRKNLEIVLTHE